MKHSATIFVELSSKKKMVEPGDFCFQIVYANGNICYEQCLKKQ
jgi:hypothetical protein